MNSNMFYGLVYYSNVRIINQNYVKMYVYIVDTLGGRIVIFDKKVRTPFAVTQVRIGSARRAKPRSG